MFRFANMSDRKDLISLWYDCFGDGEKFVGAFLDNFLKEDTAFVCEEAGRVVSVVYALDCMIGNKKACYFYAVATDSRFRRRGLARKEIEFLIDYKSKKGAEIFLLTASNEKNNAYYKHLGFEDSFYCGVKTFYKTDSEVSISEDFTPAEIYNLREKVFSGEGFVSFPKEHVDFALKYTQRVFTCRENGNLTGYAMVDGKKITEVCCEKNTDDFISAILSEIDGEKADVYLPLNNYDGCKISRGMVYYTDKKSKNQSGENVFLSLNLE
ncbi:MAG: GNAT family N-acetyltransferase [Ruminococcaceae bacterium]|nr:GNAT family N-acetyltransferase [Oscillospiraceae bacterium]